VARIGSGKTSDPFEGPGFPEWLPVVLFLSGILLARKSAKLAGALVLAGILGVFGISGCGGGGGTSSAPPPAASNNITHTAAGLAPNTTYYWKVEADDGLASTASTTRSFTTGN
jgi:hypothetical protein